MERVGRDALIAPCAYQAGGTCPSPTGGDSEPTRDVEGVGPYKKTGDRKGEAKRRAPLQFFAPHS